MKSERRKKKTAAPEKKMMIKFNKYFCFFFFLNYIHTVQRERSQTTRTRWIRVIEALNYFIEEVVGGGGSGMVSWPAKYWVQWICFILFSFFFIFRRSVEGFGIITLTLCLLRAIKWWALLQNDDDSDTESALGTWFNRIEISTNNNNNESKPGKMRRRRRKNGE